MTFKFNNVYVGNKYSFLFSDKYDPIIKANVDKFKNDYYLGEKTIEEAECKSQKISFDGLLNKCNLIKNDISLLIGGDLQNQILSSTLCALNYDVSTLGIYSACATFIEGMILASKMVNKGENIVVTSSSHNLVSEKQFRFPVEYGAVRKRVNTCTASASISVLINKKKSDIKIESATIGHVCSSNHKDTNDMGSAMARGCIDTLVRHLKESNRSADYYDLILTGDLGVYGLEIVKRCYKKIMKAEINNILDAGSIYYTKDNIYAGSSGPVCLPLVFFDYIVPSKKYKKILLLGTGSLHSVVSSNLCIAIPSICHAISIEVK